MKFCIFDDMEQCTENEVYKLQKGVPAMRTKQALAFKHTFGQFACLKSYHLLHQMLVEEKLILPSQELNFGFTKKGKPFLTDFPDIHFNISHCNKAIAVVVNDKPIGIDVEKFTLPSDAMLDYTMNATEIFTIKSSLHPEQIFTTLWTQKEAVLKFRGTGINSALPTVLEQAYRDGIKTETHLDTSKGYVYTIAFAD